MPQLPYPQERAPDTQWIGDWVGHGANQDALEKRDFLAISGIKHKTEL